MGRARGQGAGGAPEGGISLVARVPYPLVVVVGDEVVYANDAAVHLKVGPLVGTPLLDHVHPDDHDRLLGRLEAMLDGRDPHPVVDLRVLLGDGGELAVEATGMLVPWGDDVGIQAVLVDVSERLAAEAELGRASQRFRAIIDSLAEGVAVFDAEGRLELVNRAALQLFSLDLPAGDVVRASVRSLVGTFEDESGVSVPFDELLDRIRLAVRGEIVPTQRVLRHQPPDGPARWLSLGLRVLSTEPGLTDAGAVLSIVDVTGLQDAAARLDKLARYDPLTGLANRRLALERLQACLQRVRPTAPHGVGVFFIDLDGFKDVNDRLGHAAGDELLVVLAERLRSVVRPDDVVARFGGDEFVLVADPVDGVLAAESLAERLLAAVRPPVQLGQHSVSVSASVGIALSGGGLEGGHGAEDRADAEVLLAEADRALYRAKRDGRGRYELYDEGMRARVHRRVALEGDLRAAIAGQQLHVVHQPIFRLGPAGPAGAPATDVVAAVEAFVRWEHPDLGALSPSEFVALAEDTGLAGALGGLVLDLALADAARWWALGHEVPVAVNASGRHLEAPGLVGSVEAALAARALPPRALVVEVGEATASDLSAGGAAALAALRALGVCVALDDFGTGSAALVTLRALPVEVIKLDGALHAGIAGGACAGVDGRRSTRDVVAAVVQLAHAVGFVAVAEGVEDRDQLEALRDLGCDMAQGYGLAPIVPLADLLPILAARA